MAWQELSCPVVLERRLPTNLVLLYDSSLWNRLRGAPGRQQRCREELGTCLEHQVSTPFVLCAHGLSAVFLFRDAVIVLFICLKGFHLSLCGAQHDSIPCSMHTIGRERPRRVLPARRTRCTQCTRACALDCIHDEPWCTCALQVTKSLRLNVLGLCSAA